MTQPALHTLLEQLAERLQITRPLAAIDTETTGVNPETDRIVEITIARIDPDTRSVQSLETRVNPAMAIPAEASAIHGIRDEDVTGCPLFAQLAPMVERLLTGADIVSFNGKRFDVRLIAAEMKRLQRPDPCDGARHIDVQTIYHRMEPRTLSAGVLFYCGDLLTDAHGTTADVTATLRVLLSQLDRYAADLPASVEAIDALDRDPSFIDKDGKFAWRSGQACVNFGTHKGTPLAQVDRGFLRWMLNKDFTEEAKAIARDALSGKYPAAPASQPESIAS